MFKKKTETIPFNAFMDGNWKEKKAETRKENLDQWITKASMVGAGGVTIFQADSVHAVSVEGVASDVIMSAFRPIIDLVQGVSYPVAFLMLSGGFILIMTGQTGRGMSMIKWSCIGYLGLQFAPGLMEMIIQIGNSIQESVATAR